MKLSEIRIGSAMLIGTTNVPSFDDIEYTEIVFSLSWMKKISANPILYNWKPIPITTERLKHFKFNELNENHWHIGTRSFFVKETPDGFILVLHIDEKGMKFVRLNAVHELQNLYQALTKEEL